MVLGSNSLFSMSTTLGSIYRFRALICWNQQKTQLDKLFKEIQFWHKTLTYVNLLKLLISVACVRRCRHIESQSNHVLTGAYVSNQSTNGGVRQLWKHRLWLESFELSRIFIHVTFTHIRLSNLIRNHKHTNTAQQRNLSYSCCCSFTKLSPSCLPWGKPLQKPMN